MRKRRFQCFGLLRISGSEVDERFTAQNGFVTDMIENTVYCRIIQHAYDNQRALADCFVEVFKHFYARNTVALRTGAVPDRHGITFRSQQFGKPRTHLS
ncbi:hypothetical protein D3C87_1659920 [compost metagenome]